MEGFAVLKHVSLYGLAGLGAFCLTILLLSQLHSSPLKDQIRSMLRADCPFEMPNKDEIEDVDVLDEIKRVIDRDRKMVHEDMAGYRYPDGKYNTSASKLGDLVIEDNGRPVRSVILTTWRTGSTFLGEIVGSHPGNFQHFEPLADLGMVKFRGPPMAENPLNRIRALLNCDYSDERDKSINFARIHPYVLQKTSYLWDQCAANSSICYDHRYLSEMCKLFPFQSMKIIRLSLYAGQELLADEKLAIRLVLLVRDPRGIIRSRKHKNFCRNSPDCSEPALLCADLVSDYKIAVKLMEKYPATFRVKRYEDLAADPYQQAEELSEFYGRYFHPKMIEYLDTHTRSRSGGSFSTFRNTKTTPYHWRTELEFDEVEEIQETCALAMKYWGYLPAMNATHLREFHPVTDYDLSS